MKICIWWTWVLMRVSTKMYFISEKFRFNSSILKWYTMRCTYMSLGVSSTYLPLFSFLYTNVMGVGLYFCTKYDIWLSLSYRFWKHSVDSEKNLTATSQKVRCKFGQNCHLSPFEFFSINCRVPTNVHPTLSKVMFRFRVFVQQTKRMSVQCLVVIIHSSSNYKNSRTFKLRNLPANDIAASNALIKNENAKIKLRWEWRRGRGTFS